MVRNSFKIFRKPDEKEFKKLYKEYGNRKRLLKGFELQCLLALSYFPELKDIKIEFKFVVSKNTLSCKPVWYTVPFEPGKRIYRVCVSLDIHEEKVPVLLSNLTFNQQIGVIGHELSHVVDYLHKDTLSIIKCGLLYYYKPFQRVMEKTTDLRAVKHGLGNELIDYALLVDQLKEKFPKEKYYTTYNRIYMSAKEIRRALAILSSKD